ncbi:cellulose synthase/poly-beta-1,6-N-acetylglucosamine synthase-like glycosyltransferase [Litoreibacter halocynthiae]|uniref:Cellulose synthase/poly-beta-1,6-N-acetylglucosamine synthase-like glycosyltransferase n=1 Tax=Litoreibacter halocynthiae TaxID=1242689 RepID=A0A4R7LK41_9RHOB|nr:glycosyltransferase [Litoreibacter halocynthiae]TDT74761.1 cellulose synthase/poly-beta-1,6-N-acetylglucosamine synthase-like glycosyltransferase [Litoreibacter halocynthiae]
MNAPLKAPVRIDAHPEQRVFLDAPLPDGGDSSHPLLGKLLVDQGLITPPQLLIALALQARQNVPLGEILIAQGHVAEEDILRILAKQHGTHLVNLEASPPDPRLAALLVAEDCLRLGFMPWRRRGDRVVIATAHPERIGSIRVKLPLEMSDAKFVLAAHSDVQNAIHTQYGDTLATQAEHRTAPQDSCRNWSTGAMRLVLLTVAALSVAGALFAPVWLIWSVFGAASLALALNSTLKAACTVIALKKRPLPAPPERPRPALRLPKISILVPLFRERDIAGALVKRLARLSYPHELLEICLVVEASDTVTENALTKGGLPRWMRVVRVPKGGVQTKPRALNYALDFTSGSLVGVYDAEDAPDADQLHQVARKFAEGGADLACVQGILSFYNAKTNWLSRCFFFEYAGWFRVMLPGLQKLGFAIPLGGTTLFFRRDVLVKLGAWDAHNVTEDADLGMRLARRGYRCEMMQSVTQEEANSHVWPWVKQRSRWLKGYAVTWCVHMRKPVLLWRELGTWKFIGFQILFLSTLMSFFLAPVLWWSLLTFLFDWPNPVFDPMPKALVIGASGFFLLAELVTLAVFVTATANIGKRPHIGWILTLPAYFIFGTVAAYKGLAELLFNPFYWDKTEHGMFGGASDGSLGNDRPCVDSQPRLEGDGQMVPQRF